MRLFRLCDLFDRLKTRRVSASAETLGTTAQIVHTLKTGVR